MEKKLQKLIEKFNRTLEAAQDARAEIIDYLEEKYDITNSDVINYIEDKLDWCYGIDISHIESLIKEKGGNNGKN